MVVGMETRSELLERTNTLDLAYSPVSDMGTANLSVKQWRVKLVDAFAFDKLRAPPDNTSSTLNSTAPSRLRLPIKSQEGHLGQEVQKQLDGDNRFDFELYKP